MPSNKPLILGDSLFEDVVLHQGHVVTTSGTEIAGNELFNIADNLRDLTWFAVTQTNTTINIDVNCGVAKNASCVVLDRGHNLKSSEVKVIGSTNAFSTSTTVADSVLPATAGGLASDTNGCLTTEGVWWKTWASQSFQYWRFQIPAMGASLSPLITGLYLGDFYRFPEYLDAPAAYDYRIKNVVMKNAATERGVRIKRRIINYAEVQLAMQLEDVDFLGFHTQVQNLFYSNHPWWFCLDDSVNIGGTDLMRLFQLPGDLTYDPVADPVHRVVNFLLEEVAPSHTL